MKRAYLYLFLCVVSLNIFLSGGRIASSDELAVFLTTESLVERGQLSVNPELVRNGIYGRDGKFYTGSGIGQPVLAIPFYLTGKFVAHLLPISNPLKVLLVRASVSLLNQFFAGLIAVVMFAFGMRLGYPKKVGMILTLGLLFSTNLFPYLKSFMREPELLFYLLVAIYFLYNFKIEGKPKCLFYSGLFCGLGFLTRVTFVINFPFLLLYLLAAHREAPQFEPGKKTPALSALLMFSLFVVVAIGVNFAYDYVQFGNILTTGYSGRGGFTTPIFVGLYGLLFSSGKSFFLYAPLSVLAFASIRYFSRTNRMELYLFAALFLVNLVFFGKFVAWAGDGSWGPRYLIPTLPFLLLPIGALIQESKTWKRIALGLAAVGLVIQIGGISIYLGNYMRETGEFPYTKTFDDPEFLYKSHFIPNYSPVVGHWKMLLRNVQVNFSDSRPRFTVMNSEERIPLSAEDKVNLLYTLDFWFMYASYAGIHFGNILPLAILLLALSTTFGYKTWRALSTSVSINRGKYPA